MEINVWRDLWASVKVTGLCCFYPDLSCCNTRRVPSPIATRGHILGSQALGDSHKFWGAGALLSPISLLVLFLPCSLLCRKLSPGTQEAAVVAPNSPPTVRRRGRNRSLLEGPRTPMTQATLLDTGVQGPVGCGVASNQEEEV